VRAASQRAGSAFAYCIIGRSPGALQCFFIRRSLLDLRSRGVSFGPADAVSFLQTRVRHGQRSRVRRTGVRPHSVAAHGLCSGQRSIRGRCAAASCGRPGGCVRHAQDGRATCGARQQIESMDWGPIRKEILQAHHDAPSDEGAHHLPQVYGRTDGLRRARLRCPWAC
jgi:hypothetical protein